MGVGEIELWELEGAGRAGWMPEAGLETAWRVRGQKEMSRWWGVMGLRSNLVPEKFPESHKDDPSKTPSNGGKGV